MINVIAKKSGKYLGQRKQKGQSFTISNESEFNVEWMKHSTVQTKEAQLEIITLSKRIKNGISNIRRP